MRDIPFSLQAGDALVVTDIQLDFLPGGALGVPRGDEVIPVFNRYIAAFQARGLPVFATRDWHPENHSSFHEQGGIWPPHCVANSEGARFSPELKLPEDVEIVSKATEVAKEAYSTFEGTGLAERLRELGVRRVFIGGLATDYCVVNSVRDAVAEGFDVFFLEDASRAINLNPGDERAAIDEMRSLGAVPLHQDELAA